MNPQNPKQNFGESIDHVDKDEVLLAIIKRHPFGIIKIYIQSAIGICGAVALIAFVLPGLTDLSESTDMFAILATGLLIVAAVMIIILMIATIIYYQSNITVTTKTITQTLQLSLFAKKTSQLSVTSIEDVTSNKSGFFPTMFNFGRLMVETAGEQENFHFDYCPHPEHYAKLILDTRQQYMGFRDDRALNYNPMRIDNHTANAAPAEQAAADQQLQAEADMTPSQPAPPVNHPTENHPALPQDNNSDLQNQH